MTREEIINRYPYLFELARYHLQKPTFNEWIRYQYNILLEILRFYINPKKVLELIKHENILRPPRFHKFRRSIYPIAFGFEHGPGWDKLVFNLIKNIAKNDPFAIVRIFQIKEKFGGLRFYIEYNISDSTNNPINMIEYQGVIEDLIEKAEKKSFKICETCGSIPARQVGKGWIYTLCKKCEAEYENKERIR